MACALHLRTHICSLNCSWGESVTTFQILLADHRLPPQLRKHCREAGAQHPPPGLLHCCFQDDIDFEIGEGVEEFLRLLEEGRPLPADPRQAGRPKESARSFLARMGRLRARYNAQFLKRKDWQASAAPVSLLLATPTGPAPAASAAVQAN